MPLKKRVPPDLDPIREFLRTAEFEVAEMKNLRAEAEIQRNHMEQRLSQETHMFNQARNLITEMIENFSIEDQGCIRIEESKCWKPKEMNMLQG